jgi:hypothetical protein
MQQWLKRFGLNSGESLIGAAGALSMLAFVAASCAAILVGGVYVLVAHVFGWH